MAGSEKSISARKRTGAGHLAWARVAPATSAMQAAGRHVAHGGQATEFFAHRNYFRHQRRSAPSVMNWFPEDDGS